MMTATRSVISKIKCGIRAMASADTTAVVSSVDEPSSSFVRVGNPSMSMLLLFVCFRPRPTNVSENSRTSCTLRRLCSNDARFAGRLRVVRGVSRRRVGLLIAGRHRIRWLFRLLWCLLWCLLLLRRCDDDVRRRRVGRRSRHDGDRIRCESEIKHGALRTARIQNNVTRRWRSNSMRT